MAEDSRGYPVSTDGYDKNGGNLTDRGYPSSYSNRVIVTGNNLTDRGFPASYEGTIVAQGRRTAVKNSGSTSGDKAFLKEDNRLASLWDACYEATLVLKGTFDVDILDVIDLTVYCRDGREHYTSGLYEVSERTDSIEGDFTTTLKVFRIGAGSHGNGGYGIIAGSGSVPGSLVHSGAYASRFGYPCKVPVIHGVGTGQDIVRNAYKYIGVPYIYGGKNPKKGIDCSYFVCLALWDTGVYSGPYLNSSSLRGLGEEVPPDKVGIGDIICYNGHVAIYIDENTRIHASSKAGKVTTAPHVGGVLCYRRVY